MAGECQLDIIWVIAADSFRVGVGAAATLLSLCTSCPSVFCPTWLSVLTDAEVGRKCEVTGT